MWLTATIITTWMDFKFPCKKWSFYEEHKMLKLILEPLQAWNSSTLLTWVVTLTPKSCSQTSTPFAPLITSGHCLR